MAVVSERTKDLVIERIFDAPREQVWQAWTDPATGKTPTKISGFKGNSDLMKVLLNALAGKYNP